MPSFIALGCLEVGEKFMWVGWWPHFHTRLHQPKVGLGWAVTKRQRLRVVLSLRLGIRLRVRQTQRHINDGDRETYRIYFKKQTEPKTERETN